MEQQYHTLLQEHMPCGLTIARLETQLAEHQAWPTASAAAIAASIPRVSNTQKHAASAQAIKAKLICLLSDG
jgi:hypothetical protein